jgi:diguanylate cyclase (GGDEF)-like protein
MRHQALHDPLTGLPNRSLLASLLENALERERRSGATVGVLLLDLDNFKLINDSLGHLAGDSLLAALTPRLRRVVRKADVLARFGGDEFVVIAGQLKGEGQAVALAERITRALTRPFVVEGAPHTVSASIGIALAPAGQGTVDGLLRDADAAMYEAKRRGGGAHRVFDADMTHRSVTRLRLVSDLRGAFERDELDLAFQPIVSLRGRAHVGAEALLRWNASAGRGRPIPEVIAAAEESGLINPLGAWAIDRALGVLARGDTWEYVSVNLSPRQVSSGEVAPLVERLLEQHGVEPRRLVLEITETALFDETGASLATIAALHRLGVLLALDDFGTGFSSLQHLLRFPIDVLKIDRAFISRLPEDRRARAIISSVTAMAHELDKRVVAEGIETATQLEAVRELGCDLGQGFLLGRPAPAPAG